MSAGRFAGRVQETRPAKAKKGASSKKRLVIPDLIRNPEAFSPARASHFEI
jgi:hypothetical protein